MTLPTMVLELDLVFKAYAILLVSSFVGFLAFSCEQDATIVDILQQILTVFKKPFVIPDKF